MKEHITLVEREHRTDDVSKFNSPINIINDLSNDISNFADGQQVYDVNNKRMLFKKDGKLMKLKLNSSNEIIMEVI